jgi:hypothetical protein
LNFDSSGNSVNILKSLSITARHLSRRRRPSPRFQARPRRPATASSRPFSPRVATTPSGLGYKSHRRRPKPFLFLLRSSPRPATALRRPKFAAAAALPPPSSRLQLRSACAQLLEHSIASHLHRTSSRLRFFLAAGSNATVTASPWTGSSSASPATPSCSSQSL